MAHNILIVGELVDGAPTSTTLELLGGAQGLAAGGTVAITLLGTGATAAAAKAAGASKAFVSDDAARQRGGCVAAISRRQSQSRLTCAVGEHHRGARG